jgi:hypothetical protein
LWIRVCVVFIQLDPASVDKHLFNNLIYSYNKHHLYDVQYPHDKLDTYHFNYLNYLYYLYNKLQTYNLDYLNHQQDRVSMYFDYHSFSNPYMRISMWPMVLKPSATLLRPPVMHHGSSKLRHPSPVLLPERRMAQLSRLLGIL